MNWLTILGAAGYGLAGIIILSIVSTLITNQVIKARQVGAYRAELDAPELGGYGGKIHVSVDSEDELIKFLQRYSQDIIRWPESPDRVKR